MPAPMQNRALKISSTGESVKKTYYFRDAQGNVLATYSLKQNVLTLEEIDIYGSSRLGLLKPNLQMYPSIQAENKDFEGKKNYELSNHLGNVLAVISDRKKGSGSVNGNYAYFEAVTISATDYYPFGMAMPSRTYNTEGYRYGFNGKENDSEWAKQDYGMRISDPRIARFLSIDPLTIKYPFYTPYQFASNTPIMAIDVDGMESDKQVNSTEKFVTGYKRGFLGQLNAIDHNIKTFFKDVLGSRFCPFGDCGNANSNKETYITPFVAPPTSAEGWEKLGASVGDKLYSLYDGDPEAWGEVAGASTWGYMSGSAIASSTAELRAANNVLDDLVVPATKTGPVLTEIEAVTLEQRAKDIHGSQTSPVARNKSTIAVAEVTNADGTKTTLVGSSRKYLTREERASLKVGEERVSGKGHAETTILDHAAKNGQKVERIGTSRPVCGKCAPALKEKGVKIESPEKAYKKPKI